MTIQQEFARAARIAENRVFKAHPEVSLTKLLNRLSVPELEVMRNEVARVYAELVDQALQHVNPDGKNEVPNVILSKLSVKQQSSSPLTHSLTSGSEMRTPPLHLLVRHFERARALL